MAEHSARHTVKKQGDISHILYPFVFIFLHLLVLSLARTLAGSLQALSPSDVNGLASILAALLLVPLFSIFIRWRQRAYPELLYQVAPSRGVVLQSLVLLLAAQALSLLWLLFLDTARTGSDFIAQRVEQYNELLNKIVAAGQSIPLMLCSTVLTVPLVEELLYRGIVFGELRHILPTPCALFVQALLFALVHGNFVQAVYAFLLGLNIGYIYYKSKSFLLAFLAHALFNFLGGALPQILPADSPLLVAVRAIGFLCLVSMLLRAIYRLLQRRVKNITEFHRDGE